jgi:hypothetical protein
VYIKQASKIMLITTAEHMLAFIGIMVILGKMSNAPDEACICENGRGYLRNFSQTIRNHATESKRHALTLVSTQYRFLKAALASHRLIGSEEMSSH